METKNLLQKQSTTFMSGNFVKLFDNTTYQHYCSIILFSINYIFIFVQTTISQK